jgi:hypothetical protein
MTYHWNFTYQLAGHLDSGSHAAAVALLHEQAEHFIVQSESRNTCTIGSIWLQRKARWLIHAVNALPDLEKAEEKVRQERLEIRETDAQLVAAVADLQKYIGDCASAAANLTEAYLLPASHYPVQPASRSHFYCSPLSYLQSFAGSRPPVAYYYKYGKPVQHATIESEDYDHTLFVDLAMNTDWQRYFYGCLDYFAERFGSAHVHLPVRKLLQLSKLNVETGIDGFSKEKAASKIDEVRKLYMHRAEIRERVWGPLGETDYFYECLKCCEKHFFIAPIFLPSAPARFFGNAPLGMPFYPDMHPHNALKPYSSLAYQAERILPESKLRYSS